MFDALCSPPNDRNYEDDDDEIAALVAVFDSERQDGGEGVVPLYLGNSFKEHFHMTKTTAMAVVDLLTRATRSVGRPPISTELHVLSSLWLLANKESFQSVGYRFGMAKSLLHRSFMDFCTEMNHLRGDYIKWPEGSDATKCLQEFNILRGPHSFPGVIGCLDAIHIMISRVVSDASSYRNRKGLYSVILQAICDANLRFTDVFAGYPGSFSDNEVWKSSPICMMLQETPIEEGIHLLGDNAYPLETHLIVPYEHNGNMSERQKIFNRRLSSTRVIIEDAFRLLKKRFRRLDHLDVKDLVSLPRIITTCCIIHNICIASADMLEYDRTDIVGEGDVGDHDYATSRCFKVSKISTAIVKRDFLAEELYNLT